ncbi:Coronin-like protein [Hondaea fermentalgiana]|uniref:Coronin n=1 Tax=Hondaea fermentalgiana TaxID=2315210 RepID=A0A2R5G173_9STRA|nr:Coronin-like protein [Hondaea fermentalgiana]|eukprot:GBG24767.1 Coronin-like protein [Hondaea fermentalgiana]
MSRFVRASKVRHVYCQPSKPEEHYSNIRLSTATGDHNYIKVNTKYFAVPVATGNGSLAVHNLDQPGRLPAQPAVLDGHRGAVLDFDFNPCHEQLIATGGDDCTIKVWGIPEEGLTETMSEPLVDMHEHQRKVVVVRFHPTAEHVLASGSADHMVKVWDVQNGASKVDIPHEELLQDVVWSYDGSMLATSSKDKQMRLIDPRSGEVTGSVEAHNGTKTSKLTFLGEHGTLCSVGFTRQSKRQFKIWDPRKISTPLSTTDIDQAAGVIMPFFDEGSNLLYLGGKGDGNIRYYEIVNDAPWSFNIETYRAASPCRGLAIMPKRAVNTEKVELTRLFKLTSNTVEPLSFICPRKSDLFQEDLYPDCYAGKPAMSADEFFAGKNKKPVLMSMDPSKRSDAPSRAAASHALKKQQSPQALQAEVDKLNAYVEKLTSLLESKGIDVPEP